MKTQTAPREIQIPFSPAMMLAAKAGLKTQTRRLVRPQPEDAAWPRWAFTAASTCKADRGTFSCSVLDPAGDNFTDRGRERVVWRGRCPYGQPGDVLWFRENFRLPKSLDAMNCTQVAERMLDLGYTGPWAPIRYEADGATVNATERTNSPLSLWGGEWGRLRVARFMPRWASRATAQITGIGVERVQSISPEDAEAEGIYNRPHDAGLNKGGKPGWCWKPGHYAGSARHGYELLWDSLNGRTYPWASNPWVWVVKFKQPTFTC